LYTAVEVLQDTLGVSMEAGATLPAALQSPAAEAWQVEFAKMLPELERLSK
jgi:hypothetical protein